MLGVRTAAAGLTLLLLLLLLAACAGTPAEDPFAIPDDEPRERVIVADPPVRLYVFDCGRLRYDDVGPLGLDNRETAVREFFVPCYVVDHEQGQLLWELGLPSDVALAGGWVPAGPGVDMRLERTLAEQLADVDLAMGDFERIAFSHLMFDHVGAAEELEDGVLLIQKQALAEGFGDDVDERRFPQPLYASLAHLPTHVLDGAHDVFGDGRVVIFPAPGPSAGHQVLYIELVNNGPVLLSGDLYFLRGAREALRVPPVHQNAANTRVSMGIVEALLIESRAMLLIQHDLEQHRSLRRAPQFYQ